MTLFYRNGRKVYSLWKEMFTFRESKAECNRLLMMIISVCCTARPCKVTTQHRCWRTLVPLPKYYKYPGNIAAEQETIIFPRLFAIKPNSYRHRHITSHKTIAFDPWNNRTVPKYTLSNIVACFENAAPRTKYVCREIIVVLRRCGQYFGFAVINVHCQP